MTYEPYLSTVRDKPEAGKILATTLDYPMVMDTFGCTPDFLKANAKARAGAGRQLLRGAGHDQGGPGQGVRDHGRGGEAVRRAVREVAGLPALAGPGGQPEVLRRRHSGLHQGGGRPPAASRASSRRARRRDASSTPASSSKATLATPGSVPMPARAASRPAPARSSPRASPVLRPVLRRAGASATLGGFVSPTFLADPLTMVEDGWHLLADHDFSTTSA